MPDSTPSERAPAITSSREMNSLIGDCASPPHCRGSEVQSTFMCLPQQCRVGLSEPEFWTGDLKGRGG